MILLFVICTCTKQRMDLPHEERKRKDCTTSTKQRWGCLHVSMQVSWSRITPLYWQATLSCVLQPRIVTQCTLHPEVCQHCHNPDIRANWEAVSSSCCQLSTRKCCKLQDTWIDNAAKREESIYKYSGENKLLVPSSLLFEAEFLLRAPSLPSRCPNYPSVAAILSICK